MTLSSGERLQSWAPYSWQMMFAFDHIVLPANAIVVDDKKRRSASVRINLFMVVLLSPGAREGDRGVVRFRTLKAECFLCVGFHLYEDPLVGKTVIFAVVANDDVVQHLCVDAVECEHNVLCDVIVLG